MKVFDGNPREGIEIGNASDEGTALAMLREHFRGTGEDRLYGVTKADFGADFTGEVFVPRLRGIN